MKPRINQIRCIIFLLLWAAQSLAPNSLAAHKFHASFTQMEYNAKARSVEVTVRVFADDLEAILSKREKRRIQADRISNPDKLVGGYVREHLKVRADDGKEIALDWVGIEVKIDSVWIYIEGKLPNGLQSATVSDSLFFDLFDDQINTVSIKEGERRSELIFRFGDKPKPALP